MTHRTPSHPRSLATLGALGILWGTASWLTAATSAIAQVNSTDSVCYMQTPEGRHFDLSALCPGFDPANFEPAPLYPTSAPSPISAATPVNPASSDSTPSNEAFTITLQWEDNVDLQLLITEPEDNQIHAGKPTAASGGQLDNGGTHNCEQPSPTLTETVSWPAGMAAPGTYGINIHLADSCNNGQAPIPISINVNVNGQILSASDTLGIHSEFGNFDILDYFLVIPEAGSLEPITLQSLAELMEELEDLEESWQPLEDAIQELESAFSESLSAPASQF